MRNINIWSLLILGLLTSDLFARDMILFKDGRELEVVVTKETADDVEFKDATTGASLKKDVDDIDTITYEDAPREYLTGVTALRNKDLGTALKQLAAAKKNFTSSRNWQGSYIDYYFALTVFRIAEDNPSKSDIAIQKLKAVFDDHKDSRFAVPALYYIGSAQLLKKDFAGARQTFEAVSKFTKRARWVAKAKAGIAQAYMEEGNIDEALNVCLGELKSGNFSGEILSALTVVLIDKKKDYQMAYNISSKLTCRGDAELKRNVHELKGCAAFYLKNYDEALDDLLRCTLLFSSTEEDSSRPNVYLAATIKVLMGQKPNEYPDWEYQTKLSDCYRKMTVADQKLYKTFKL